MSAKSKILVVFGVLAVVAAGAYYYVVPKWEADLEKEVRAVMEKAPGKLEAKSVKASFFDKSLRLEGVTFEDAALGEYAGSKALTKISTDLVLAEGISPTLLVNPTGVNELFSTLTITNLTIDTSGPAGFTNNAHYDTFVVNGLEFDFGLAAKMGATNEYAPEDLVKFFSTFKVKSFEMKGYTGTSNVNNMSVVVTADSSKAININGLSLESAMGSNMKMDMAGMGKLSVESISYGKFDFSSVLKAYDPKDPDSPEMFNRMLANGGFTFRDMRVKKLEASSALLGDKKITLDEYVFDVSFDDKGGVLSSKVDKFTMPSSLLAMALPVAQMPAIAGKDLVITKEFSANWKKDEAAGGYEIVVEKAHADEPILGSVDLQAKFFGASNAMDEANDGDFNKMLLKELTFSLEDKELVNSAAVLAGQTPQQARPMFAAAVTGMKTPDLPAAVQTLLSQAADLLLNGGSISVTLAPEKPMLVQDLELPNLGFVKSTYTPAAPKK